MEIITNKSKTVKEVADEIGVSRQAIYLKIKKEPLSSTLQPYLTRIGKVLYIENTGVQLILSEFVSSMSSEVVNHLTSDVNGIVSFLKVQLEEKDRQIAAKDIQLAEKDKQIIELISTNKAQAQSINADRHNELAETIQLAISETLIANKEPLSVEDNATVDSRNWLQKLFKQK